MKLSVSLADDAVAFIDELTSSGRYPSRSAALAAAVRALREQQAYPEYVEMFNDPEYQRDSAEWDALIADGLPS